MSLDPATCYPALRARDTRFDGVFFVAVSTTGIYCRPVCPARLPALARCTFFDSAARAEQAGFRACLRCRPELAPGHGSVDAVSRLVRLAAVRIGAGFLNDHSVEALGASLGVTSRHLRRAMEAEIGVSPIELAQSGRLALARRLLRDTTMPLHRVAAAAGFSSVRRFNASFEERLGRSPTTLRRAELPREGGPRGSSGDADPGKPDRGDADRENADEGIVLRLDYRPPYGWDDVLRYLAGRAIPGVERVVDGEYRRTVVMGKRVGWLAVAPWKGRSALAARVAPSLAPCLMEIAARVRAVFDLDARPDLVAAHLGKDPALCALVRARPGLRVPGTFDGFELAVRAVLGQQVSVAAATTLSGRLVARFGSQVEGGLAGIDRAFPPAERLASATLADVRDVGLPATRARTVIDLSRAVTEGRVDLSPWGDPEPVVRALQEIPGIGPWTAGYVALRALRWPDAFLGGDLGIRKALGVRTTKDAEARAERFRPWRAYAVLHLWHSLS